MHLLSPYLICGKGPCIGHLGPCGPPSEPPKDKIYPQKEPFVFSRFPRGLGPVILSGNCQMQLFFSHPTSHGKGRCIGHLGPWGPPSEPPKNPTSPVREEKVYLAVSREYNWSLPFWNAAKDKGLVLGVNIVVWGLQWGSPGSQMAYAWPLATGEVG